MHGLFINLVRSILDHDQYINLKIIFWKCNISWPISNP